MASQLNTTPNWPTALGTVLPGGYELVTLLRMDGQSALFRTRVADDSAADGFARLIYADSAETACQLESWQAITRVSHPNLLQIIKTGDTRVGNGTAVYVVTEGADESLPAVLSERSLTADEASAVFDSIVPALACLHDARLVHGRVSPAEVYAAGETIKISAECATGPDAKAIAPRGAPAYLAPEHQDENSTPQADVWCLGATLFEVLTQARFSPERVAETAALPEKFKQIIRRCVDPNPAARPSLAEIPSLYRSNEVAESVASAPDLASEMNDSTVSFVPPSAKRETGTRLPLALAIAALFLLLAGGAVWWNSSKPAQQAPEPAPDAKTVTREVAPEPTPAAPSTSVVPVDVPNEAVVSHPVEKPQAQSTGAPVWRVVLWTYKNRSDAQSKVDALTVLYPDLHAEVFTPNTDAAFALVVAGGEMSREQAKETQRKARELGLPRDSYIQNFTH